METPFFFNNNNYRLFGVLHEPELSSSTQHASPNTQHPSPYPLKGLGLVFCHPFAEEKLISHRVMVNLARRFAKEGICCLRFDEMGHGDSDGNFEDSTVETRLSDTRCAIDYLRKQTGVKKIGLLGVRFGGTLTALTCVNVSGIDCLILVSPIIDGKSYIEQCLRSNLATQMALHKKIIKERTELIQELMAGEKVNIDGYLLTKDLYEQIASIDLLGGLPGFEGRALVLQLAKTANQAIEKELEKFKDKIKADNIRGELRIIKEEHFWKDAKIYNPWAKEVEETVLNWLHEVYTP